MAPPSRSVSHRDALLELLWAPVERQSSERFDLLTSAEGITVARHNTVVLRAASRLRGFERPLPPEFLEMERLERARVATLLELVACVAEICRTLGVRFLFTKAFQHLPDMGHDVDLVLMDSTPAVIAAMVAALKAEPGPDSYCQRLAGKESFLVPGFDGPLEIHQGRLGHVGEHKILLERVWDRRGSAGDAGVPVPVPSREDALLIQVVQRVFGHRHVRLADLLRTVSLLDVPIDWNYVLDTAKRIGVTGALSDYLSVVARVYHAVTEQPLSRTALDARLSADADIRLSSEGWLPMNVVLRAYRDKFVSDVLHGDWDPVGRLCLLPMAAVTVKLHLGTR